MSVAAARCYETTSLARAVTSRALPPILYIYPRLCIRVGWWAKESERGDKIYIKQAVKGPIFERDSLSEGIMSAAREESARDLYIKNNI